MKVGEEISILAKTGTGIIDSKAIIKKVYIEHALDRDNTDKVKTKYVAQTDSGLNIVFYGYDIGKRVFPIKESVDNKQMSLFN